MVKHTQTIRRVFDNFVGLALQGLMGLKGLSKQ